MQRITIEFWNWKYQFEIFMIIIYIELDRFKGRYVVSIFLFFVFLLHAQHEDFVFSNFKLSTSSILQYANVD